MVSSSKLACHTASASNTGVPAALPLDALFEVLLRLPAKDLCRLRAVCRSWCALTKDPHFVAEHKSRHTEPLFAATFWTGEEYGIGIVGLSGQKLRLITIASTPIGLLHTHLDRLFVFTDDEPSLGGWVLNPATAGALALPGLHSDEFEGICREQISVGEFSDSIRWEITYTFGQVASTREYKVLRISRPNGSSPLLCDIITLDGSNQERWRRKQNAPSGLMRATERSETMEHITVNGVVYFLLDYVHMEPASTAPFNLDTEKWMPTLRGPEPLRSAEFHDYEREIQLVNLNGSFVIIDNDCGGVWDLWFLMDHNRSLWVNKYRLNIGSSCIDVRPLQILDDGRTVVFDRESLKLQCYDPTTHSLTDVLDFDDMGFGMTESIAVYTGSLLI